jgi:hypothetical protein
MVYLVSPWEIVIEQRFCQSEMRAGVQFRTRATLFRKLTTWIRPAREQLYSEKQTDWIRPAPRASGLRWKLQLGVPST